MDVITYEDETIIGHLNWWIYAIVIVTIFSFVLALNYIVKKINEARLENRATRLHSKASASQATSVQNQPVQNLAQVPIKINTTENSIPGIESATIKGISLVFNKEENLENKRRKEVVADESNTISADGVSDSSQDYISSISVSGKSVTSYPQEEVKPVYLGKIYEKHLNPNDSKIKIQLPEATIGPSNEMREKYQDVVSQYANEIRRVKSCDIVRIGQSKELVTIEQSIGPSKEDSMVKYDVNECTNGPIKIDHCRRTDNDSILNEIVDNVLQKKRESANAMPQKSYCQLNKQTSESPNVSITHPQDDKPSASKK